MIARGPATKRADPRRARRPGVVCALSVVLACACDDRKGPTTRDAGLTEPSPNASILPAPLASVGEPATGVVPADGGRSTLDAGASDAAPPEPRWLREDQALTPENPHETSGLTLNARFRWPDLAVPLKTPELNADGVQRARDAVAFDVLVELAGGRMRLSVASRAFSLPLGSELRARDDLYGHTLLWPDRATYTVLSPGALRSTLAEQRADVVPLVRARMTTLQAGSLLGFHTESVELSTPTGRLELEQARAPTLQQASGAWPSGATLCHLLVELVGATPALAACRVDLVPVRAAYTWPSGGHFTFEVARVGRRGDLNAGTFAVPPIGAEFRASELPPPPANLLLTNADLAELRLRPAPRSERPEVGAPKAGLLVVNHGDSTRYIAIDGAAAVRLPPGAEELLLGLRPGKYQVSARDFFGSEDAAPRAVELPARFSLGDDLEKAR